ncbi:MAG TPA: wax ester/triacylglycerol synthase family O-acyltransferase [Noviherbaspirillum sp.]|uniref:wax ester/triacylglycerol synthase family O-acyltransferase n=1 Tax=Noviherbaspirillum sp. TaxID=1926288 RepID=UPI002B45CF6A|nr:wax ester/triacylglycerol synthase family O-acyltransferase [Noviherbaspirillum sp.]HJV84436.1 wax ester/triacylglycerol synthase family O-acyltransferase [Noviherbaspirillum sp.]
MNATAHGAAAPTRETLSVIDTAWLRMDRPANLMMICGMLMFKDRVELHALREVVRTRMLCFHRFLQRIVNRENQPRWETDPNFDLDWHVCHIAVPDGEGLEDLLSELVSTPLDPARPMWQYHLVDLAYGGSAVILRVHHCYGDGFALMHVLASMTDPSPDYQRSPAGDVKGNGASRGAWERMFGTVTEVMGDAMRVAGLAVEMGMDILSHPSLALEYWKSGYALARDTAIIATMTPDAPTRLKGPLGIMKRVAWARPLSLLEVKAVGEAFGCSVNDVLLACVAGALRNYLIAQGDQLGKVEMRALVPVNCRPPGPIRELGNMFGLVFLGLPLGEADPFDRLMEVHRRMDELKQSQQPTVALGILASMGVLPEAMKENVLEALAANASAVISNVRGSAQPQYFAGKRIDRQVFWVPQSGGIGIGISILTYAGNVDFAVIADAKRVPHPEALVAGFIDEFEILLICTLLAGFGQERRVSTRAHIAQSSHRGAKSHASGLTPPQHDTSPRRGAHRAPGR